MKNFKIGEIITIKGMKNNQVFDPKVFLIDPVSKPGLRYHVGTGGVLFNLINTTKPFSDIADITILPIGVSDSHYSQHDSESRANVIEVKSLEAFEKRIALSNEQLLWAMHSLIAQSDNTDIKDAPLLNKSEFATYLITADLISMFQLVGEYGIKRGWNSATFYLDKLTEDEQKAPMMDKLLFPINN